jgi:branched-chain amino acid transport system substrate-binding protein
MVIVALSIVVAGCGGGGETTTTTAAAGGETTTTATPSAETVEVKIAAAGPFTGALSKIGLDALGAIELAVEEFNAAQDKIKVVSVEVGDDAADPAKSAAVAEKFVADSAVMGVIGPMTSSGVQAALPVVEAGGLALITQSATNDGLSQSGFATFHRICPVDAAQGGAIAGVIGDDLAGKKVYIIDDKGTYGQGLADQVEAALRDKYSITDIQRDQIGETDKEFSALISKIKAYDPDVFFAAIPSPAQFAALAKQMQAQGYEVQLVGGDGVKDQGEFIDNAGGATEGTYFSSLGPILETSTDPVTVAFVEKYIDKFGVLSMFSGQSYEAANVLLDAIQRDYDATGTVTRAGVLEALKTTKYSGILGIEIEFTEQGDLVSSGVFIGQVKDGKFTQIKEAQF